ncbi:zinc ribbon domain-containing protein [Butyrivibrio sp. X503]|uniref:zinc ribbon domain-containing protein n=1 Tax=Butyrivibrio sp. X503 TaxID=2364878 RepID=UPI000EAA91FB|nr:zinc ribbon domain-containing protein [Butyrivibrio sp. X503]RKM55225.1 zinc ribbon domain-containing protein [Butyrivibrio sp. X503]
MNQAVKSPLLTAKNIIRVLSIIVTIIFFCPSFLVSCSGQTVEVSAMTGVTGVKSYGETVAEPHPIMLVCLLLPIAIFVLMLIKKFRHEITALIVAIIALVDMIVWFIFRAGVKKAAEDKMCTVKTTGWFAFNIFLLLLIIILSVLVVIRVIRMQENLVDRFTGEGAQHTFSQMSAAVSQMTQTVGQLAGNVSSNVGKARVPKEEIMGYCIKCGTPLIFGNKFCTSCGRSIPEDYIAEAEEERRIAEEARRAAEEAARKEAEERARREAEERERREAEERARREAEEAARREEEALRRAEERARREEAAARRAEEEARREEAAERRSREAARRFEDVERYTDELTDREISKLAFGSGPAFCSSCGAKLPKGAAFCSSCGAKVE